MIFGLSYLLCVGEKHSRCGTLSAMFHALLGCITYMLQETLSPLEGILRYL
jgi:hypothetical protein